MRAHQRLNVDKRQDIRASAERDRAASIAANQVFLEHRERVRVTWLRVNEFRRPSPAFEDMNVAQLDALTPNQLERLNIKAEDFAAWQSARRQLERARRHVEAASKRARNSTAVANRMDEFAQHHGVQIDEF
jgi:hypothetical protein